MAISLLTPFMCHARQWWFDGYTIMVWCVDLKVGHYIDARTRGGSTCSYSYT
jgi:hypothetical protein